MEGLPITPWTVFLYALLTAVATGLGALPFLFTRGITPRHLGLANAAAAGLMVAASFGLIYEGVNYSLGRTLVGVGLGLLFILLAHRYLEGREVNLGDLKGLDARKALMMVGIMAVPAYLFVETFQPFLPVGLGLAAGAMIWMAAAELLPDALKEAEAEGVATVLTLSVALMVAFQILIGG